MAEKNEVVVQEEKKEVVAHNNKVTDYRDRKSVV